MFSSIQAKIVTAIVLVLAISLGGATVLSLQNQRSNLLEARRQDVANNSSTLNTSVRNVMLAGEAPIAVNLLEDLSEAPGFDTLEVYRRDGTLAFSDFSTLEEVNANLGSTAFSETPRREGPPLMNAELDQVVTFNTPRVVEDLEGQQLEYYFPILNYQECRECHGGDHFIRGVAYYEVSLASIFDRIGTARNTLILLYSLMGAAIAAILVGLMQRIVVGPIQQIGGVVSRVGEGDLEVEARVAGSREFETLSQKINSMIGGLKERNRLEVENSVIDARDQENRKYLDNIAEGLVLIDRDYRISEQYSRYVETLFATSDIAGRSFAEFIYPDPSAQQQREELEQFLGMIFENTSTEMEMIMSINPLSEKKVTVGDGDDRREIIFGTDFQRVLGEDGSVERVMAIFEDRTDIVHTQEELESERERYKSDIEHIATLLKTGPDAYSDFERSALETIAAVEEALQQLPTGEARNTLLRDLHSLKGTARYLEFFSIADLANRAESLLDNESLEELSQVVARMREEMESLGRINEKFRSFAASIAPEDSGRAALSTFLEHIQRMATDIAGELEKDVELRIDNQLDELPQLNKLQNPMIHLVRNAIDHGIEDQYQRLSAGKAGTAEITISLKESAAAYTISIGDDGAGIDLEAVRRVGVEKGVLSEDQEYSQKQLIQTLFAPSFSTRAEATDVSGRGVGLDVVHEEVRALGGKISLATRRGAGTRFTITIPKETTQ